MTKEDTIVECRLRCEGVKGCTKFSYSKDRSCHLADDTGKLRKQKPSWSRTVSGQVDKCGDEKKYSDLMEGTEYLKAKTLITTKKNGWEDGWEVRGRCPVLYYEGGKLQDIRDLPDNGFLYGDADSLNYAKLDGPNKIKIVHTTDKGSLSEIMLEVGGEGPGELFSCHWNLFVCLPENEEDRFRERLFEGKGVGLLGSPDGNSQNDWTDVDGKKLTIPRNKKNKKIKGHAAFDYCRNNWCVSQEDSLMTYPENSSYGDVKCFDEEYIEFNMDDAQCIIAKDKVLRACEEKPLPLQPPCHLECCNRGCDVVDDEMDSVQKLKKLSDEERDMVYDLDFDEKSSLCDGDFHEATGETACPSSSRSTVKVIHKTADIPDGEPIIYGIRFADAVDDDHGREVSFRLDNPFANKADAFVRYEKKVGLLANDLACESIPDLVPGCDADAKEITVGCIEYPGIEPFALVEVYFASTDPFVLGNADAGTEVDKCCKPPDYSEERVIKYSFKIQCTCLDDESST